jgi:AraC-like DNA-binding protein
LVVHTADVHSARRGKRELLFGHAVIDTEDLRAAEQALSSTFLPLRLRAHGPAGLRVRLNALKVDRTTIGYLRPGAEVRIVTEAATSYHVDIPLAGRALSRQGKAPELVTTPGSAAVFMPGAPADLTWSADTEQLCLMFAPDDVQLELTHLLGREISAPVRFHERMDLRTPAGRAWMQALQLIDREAQLDSGLLHHRLTARRLEQVLVDGLLMGHPHSYSDQLVAAPVAPGRRAVRKAVELLHARPEHTWCTSHLAAEVAVSARSLQAGFRELTGMAPMAYLRTVRLQRAHEDLLRADAAETTVSRIAHHWGFVHLSRFAAAHAEVYGEPPSKTLKNES